MLMSQKIMLYNMVVKLKCKIHIRSVYVSSIICLVHIAIENKVDVSTHMKKNMLKARIYF